MKRFLLAASLLAAVGAPVVAFAMTDSTTSMAYEGKTMTVHMIKMDDGSTLYGFTKPQLEELLHRNMDSMFTSNPR